MKEYVERMAREGWCNAPRSAGADMLEDVCGYIFKLTARIGPDVYEKALRRKGVSEMRFTGKPLTGFVFVSPDAIKYKKQLEFWVDLALRYNKVAPKSK